MSNSNNKSWKSKKRWNNKSKRPVRPRPNHFISLRIVDSKLVDALQNAQQTILEAHPEYQPHLNPPILFHFTLLLLKLDTEEEKKRAITAFEEASTVLQTHEPPVITIGELGSFGKRVIWAGLSDIEEQKQALVALAMLFESIFLKHNIIVTEKASELNPHITLFKIKYNPRRGSNKELGEEKEEMITKAFHVKGEGNVVTMASQSIFGQQIVNSLELNRMPKPKAEDGYYGALSKLHFPNSSSSTE